MKEKLFGPDESVPQWDEALAALLQEEYVKLARPLGLDDLHRLATEFSIRFDDIMDTLFRLSIHGEWHYVEPGGEERAVTKDEVERLYVNGRLHRDDLQHYTGSWRSLA